ncbi:uncharacterized protein LOC113294531 [Papaver somniferum]|uniref:uncharacterized protein LOC113294531 n=1 Tax=Papaver somniferum TaxID=3469 RepID=UPI000E700935|nr:uncharacterized protein LOC113294531 [Papaver somniferum]
MTISNVEDCLDKAVVLEPISLATFPPGFSLTDEDFEKEFNLMMVDSMDSMGAEPSSVHDLWNFLGQMNENNIHPWLLLGDFNFILQDSEKQGGNPANSFPPNFIRDKLAEMKMNAVYAFGNPFTWCNRRLKNPAELIFEKNSDDMNVSLIVIPTVDEIHNTVKCMAPWKSPEPDGYPPGFFRDNGNEVSEEKKKKTKNGFMAIKLDLSKAFDRLEWPFIIVVFKKLDFSEDWCHIIFLCISIVSYSVLVNGSPRDMFFPSRGIRQGDCLSPYIFIICMEVLSQLLLKAESDGVIQGTPLFINRDKTKSFQFIIDKFYSRLSCCKRTKLNGMGRTVVTKHVLSSLVVYHMSCFPLPKKITSKIDNIQRTFWWSKKDLRHAAYFRSWGDIGKSKLSGGIGIKNTYATNRVFIAKLGWRIIQNPDLLLSKFMKDKYFPNQNLLEVDKAADTSSWIWRGIVNSLVFVRANIVSKINDGSSTKIWSSNWIPFDTSPPISCNPNYEDYVYVSELIDVQNNCWNLNLLNSLFSLDEVIKIRTIRLNLQQSDKIMWAHTRNGIFYIKSAYRIYMNDISTEIEAYFWRKVWSLDCLPKIKFFI